MKSLQPSKQFRWVGTLSEEELLGIPTFVRHPEVDAIPTRNGQPPPRRSLHPTPPRAKHAHRRDVVALLTVGAAVWLAVGGIGDGLRSRAPAPDAPESVGSAASSMVAERDEIASLPRFFPAKERETSTGGAGHEPESETRDGEQDSSDGKHDSSPPPRGDDGGGPAERPLVEVTVPAVGRVVVDQPDAPELPDTGDTLAATLTVELP